MLTYISVVQFGIDVFPSLASLLAIQKQHIDTGPLFHAEGRLIWLTFLAIEAMLETVGLGQNLEADDWALHLAPL